MTRDVCHRRAVRAVSLPVIAATVAACQPTARPDVLARDVFDVFDVNSNLDATPPDPLVGVWITHAYPVGLPRDLVSFEQDLAVRSNGTYSITTITVRSPAAPRAGCTEVQRSAGGRWQRQPGDAVLIIDFSGSSPDTLERSGCADASLDQPDTVTATIGDPPVADEAVLDGDMLTLTPTTAGGLPMVYGRQ